MAHEHATTNGRIAMMYAEEILWHGLGTRLNEPATAHEAMIDVIIETESDGTPRTCIRQHRVRLRNMSGESV